MIPYLELGIIDAGPVRALPSTLLMTAGILLGHFLLLARAKRLGLSVETAASMSFFMVVGGMLGAKIFKPVYFPDQFQLSSWPGLALRTGMASFGGLAGGLLAAALYFAARRCPFRQALSYLDALASVFPMAWILGRTGCALAHDHPGLASNSILAVRYPDMPRFDLGLLEVIFLGAAMIPFFWVLSRQPRPAGFFLASFLTVYGAFRLLLDQLHVDPPRYAGVSVDQWAYGLATLAGLLLFRWAYSFRLREAFA